MNFVEKFVEIHKNNFKNRPIIWFFLLTILITSFLLCISYILIYFLRFDINIMSLLMFILSVVYVSFITFLLDLILKQFGKLPKVEKLCSLNRKLNELNEINKYYLKNKPLIMLFFVIIWLFLLITSFVIFSLYFFDINLFRNISSILLITLLLTESVIIFLFIYCIVAYYFSGLILLFINKFKKYIQ